MKGSQLRAFAALLVDNCNKKNCEPQIFMGASNSRSAGWDKKIALDLTHSSGHDSGGGGGNVCYRFS